MDFTQGSLNKPLSNLVFLSQPGNYRPMSLTSAVCEVLSP